MYLGYDTRLTSKAFLSAGIPATKPKSYDKRSTYYCSSTTSMYSCRFVCTFKVRELVLRPEVGLPQYSCIVPSNIVQASMVRGTGRCCGCLLVLDRAVVPVFVRKGFSEGPFLYQLLLRELYCCGYTRGERRAWCSRSCCLSR